MRYPLRLPRLTRSRFWLTLFALAMWCATGTGCGGGEGSPECGDEGCARGECADGECANPTSCEEELDCLEGFGCQQGRCEATIPCDDAVPCARGVCQAGACVNDSSCDDRQDCVRGHRCEAGRCEVDLCDGVSCERGICATSTGSCVSRDACTESNEEQACVEGEYCSQGSCVSADEICAALNCTRGVCDPSAEACVHADPCEGDDALCLEGFFCDDDAGCQPNVCDAEMIDCPRGVCEPATGECVDATPCDDREACLDGRSCVDGACVEAGAECGEQGCPGNQVCEYDVAALSAACLENPAGCARALDCPGDQVCVSGSCGAPSSCEADALEPNDDDGAATLYTAAAAAEGLVRATLCSGDVDVFTFDTNADEDFTGELLVDLAYAPQDVGAGSVAVSLLGPAGQTVASGVEAGDGQVRLHHRIGPTDGGVYTVRVAEAEAGSVGSGGLRYDLFVDLLEPTVVAACDGASVLTATPAAPVTVSGDSSAGASFELGSSCTSPANGAGEELWILEVAERSYVELEVVPGSGVDVSLSLRRQCEASAAELFCVDEGGADATEVIAEMLLPGRYVVMVEGASSTVGGDYTLRVTTTPTVCTLDAHYCSGPLTSMVCNATNTAFEPESCDEGCDTSTGRCVRDAGDVCYTAIRVNSGYTGIIDWASLQGDLELGPGSCLTDHDGTGTDTDGPDAVYEVVVPGEGVLEASLSSAGGDAVSLYLLESCDDVSASCLVGANGSRFGGESITWFNTDPQPKTVYLIADSEAQSAYELSSIEIVISQAICQPRATRCANATVETCNDLGTRWEAAVCTFGCDGDRCAAVPNDRCDQAYDLLGQGGFFSGRIDEYTDQADTNYSPCTGSSSPGPDAFFELAAAPGELVTVTLNASFHEALWITTSCGLAVPACFAGSETYNAGESHRFVAEEGHRYVAVVDSDSSGGSGLFNINATAQALSCAPGTVLGCDGSGAAVEYCDALGQVATQPCDGGCADGACAVPRGDTCVDAITLGSGESYTGDYGALNDDLNPGSGTCILDEGRAQDGGDAVFRVELHAGELLTATLETGHSNSGLYLLDTCVSSNLQPHCLTGAARSKSLRFLAEDTGTYYLVVDSDAAFSWGSFTLSVDIQPGEVCIPDTSRCDLASGVLSTCNLFGTGFVATASCPYGCAGPEFCAPPVQANDSCQSAIPLSGSVRLVDYYGRFADDLDPGAGGCLASTAPGADAVYQVALTNGEVLRATLRPADPDADPAVYLLSDCAAPATSCLAGDGATDGPASVGYRASADETIFVVVDSTSIRDDEAFLLDLYVGAPECTPGVSICLDAESAQRCEASGTWGSPRLCELGCDEVTGACVPDGSICAEALGVSDGDTASGSYVGTNTMSPSGMVGLCNFTAEAKGAEHFYELFLSPGDTLTVGYTTNSGFGIAYLLTDCADADTCQAVTAAGSSGTLTYTSPQGGQVFVVMDRTTAGSSQGTTYTLSFDVAPAP